MANEYLDDFEQAEEVKKWLRDNGSAIVMGLAVGIGGLFGYQYWQKHQVEQRLAAATAYSDLITEVSEDGLVDDGALDRFEAAFGDNAYIALAALSLAAKDLEDGNPEAALEKLAKAAKTAKPAALRDLAELRIARIQLSLGNYDQALAAVEGVSEAYSALRSEIRGDILVAQGDPDAAREAYDAALSDTNLAPQSRALVQMKRDDVAATESVDS